MTLFNNNSKKSSNVAKERLQLVLVHDRSTITPSFLNMIKSDILHVLSDYLEVEDDSIEVNISRTKTGEGMRSTLVANIPVCKVKNSAKQHLTE